MSKAEMIRRIPGEPITVDRRQCLVLHAPVVKARNEIHTVSFKRILTVQ